MDWNQDWKTIGEPKNIRTVVFGLCIIIAALLIFQAGMFVGFKKASYSFGMGENYYRTFGVPRGQPLAGFFGDDLPGGHGVVGEIVKVGLPTLVVASPDNIEKVVLVDGNTIVREGRDTLSPSDLKIDDSVIILGSPNDQGQVVARLIRIMPHDFENEATSSQATSTGGGLPTK